MNKHQTHRFNLRRRCRTCNHFDYGVCFVLGEEAQPNGTCNRWEKRPIHRTHLQLADGSVACNMSGRENLGHAVHSTRRVVMVTCKLCKEIMNRAARMEVHI